MWLALIIGVVELAIIYFLVCMIKKLNFVTFWLWLKDNRKKELNQIYQNNIDRENIDIFLKGSIAEYKQWLSNEIKNNRR